MCGGRHGPSTLYGFDFAKRAALRLRSWSLTHTQGSLWPGASLGVRCKIATRPSQSPAVTALPEGEPRTLNPAIPTYNAVAPNPAIPQVTGAPRKLQRSGKRSAHQLTRHGCTCKSAWHPVQCAATMPDAAQAGSWQGACERGGLGAPFAFNQRHLRSKCTGRTLAAGRPPPLAASFFPDSFFAGEERMEPPEGASQLAW